ncbi:MULTISPECIES: peptidylprolyl isomerase [unclassified Sphingobacterium]|uniref:peptidylprolyl isomerase n=1 Tax=unclassified Sphingobacterium TaxID=2609468 RepID=UPI001AE132BA|nr:MULTISPECIES: peptidylprolyl isomerase [unclassified Sphingobacterium]MDR6733637.1 peptidyl-prolyl cis-trans isomerase B (cyclophilin B) [Sphingobacterium sp. 2149]
MEVIRKVQITLWFVLITVVNCYAQSKHLLFKTEFGNFKAVLYDYTPHHRDLMLRSIRDHVYHDALFNRIIENFVVQGGEHDIDIAKREAADPLHQQPRLAAEFDDRAFHKMGALGAGRDGNPEKASFLNQIYFVVGKKITATELDNLELKKGIKYTATQRKEYLNNGGQPRLDHDYTVFGEIYEGFEVIMKISRLKTDNQDYPLQKVPFQIVEISK